MTLFVKNGNTFRVADEANLDIHPKLPAGNYVIKMDQAGNMFLEIVDSFQFTSKRYGNNSRNTTRILSTFMARENSTGVMLTGEKGSGKSLLAKTVSMEGALMGIPTIIINTPYTGDQFNTFIQNIDQPAIILFDEFEKVYPAEDQESILTLLDGVFPSKKLFLITCNDKWRIDKHMQNRPGRIFYMMDFVGLDSEFIREYCVDNLNNLTHIDRIITVAGLFSQFNFDMLKALIEEMNRYDESPEQSLEFLNVRPEFDGGSTYTMTLAHKDMQIKLDSENNKWHGNPVTSKKRVYVEFTYITNNAPRTLTKKIRSSKAVYVPQIIDEDSAVNYEYRSTTFSASDMTSMDGPLGKFVMKNAEGYVLTLTRYTEPPFSYGAF